MTNTKNGTCGIEANTPYGIEANFPFYFI